VQYICTERDNKVIKILVWVSEGKMSFTRCRCIVHDDVKGEWRKLHNEELHNLYSSPDIIRQVKSRRIRWAGHVARMGEERKVYKVLVGKPEGKRPLGRPRRRWKDGIRMDLGEIAWGGGGMDSTSSGQGPVAGCCECGDEPSGSRHGVS
jgi:hypothetical protein